MDYSAFDTIVRTLSAAIKNSALYAPDHPVLKSSIANFKTSLEKALAEDEKMDIGISHNNLLLNGKFVREEASDLYREVAADLHQKGIVAVSIKKGASPNEIDEFFEFLKSGEKTPSSMPHIFIKNIDYSSILTKTQRGIVTLEEKDIWQTLSRIGAACEGDMLSEAELKALIKLLKDSKRTASVLNKMYDESKLKAQDAQTVDKIRKMLSAIIKYCEGHSASCDAADIKKDLTHIVSNLDPDLTRRLFEEPDVSGSGLDLAKELFGGLSDDIIADFIASLITAEGRINENLIKLFDRLTSKDSLVRITSIVVNSLSGGVGHDEESLLKLRSSIEEERAAHPESEFISQIYKTTLKTFIGSCSPPQEKSDKFTGLLREYNEFLQEANITRERTRLLLNILWFEEEPAQFKKFSDTALAAFKESLDKKDIKSAREILELFLDRLTPEQKAKAELVRVSNSTLEDLGSAESIGRIASFIREAKNEELDDIAYALVKFERLSVEKLLDGFVQERDCRKRQRFGHILSKMTKGISGAISNRLDDAARTDFAVAKDLLNILRSVDPKGSREAMRRFIRHRDARIRMEALEGFAPETEVEIEDIFELFRGEWSRNIKNRVIAILVKTRDRAIIERLFLKLERGFFTRPFLLEFVKLCGEYKAHESLECLAKVFEKRPFFNTNRANEARAACVVSLARLDSPEAARYIELALTDKNASVRRMAKFVKGQG